MREGLASCGLAEGWVCGMTGCDLLLPMFVILKLDFTSGDGLGMAWAVSANAKLCHVHSSTQPRP